MTRRGVVKLPAALGSPPPIEGAGPSRAEGGVPYGVGVQPGYGVGYGGYPMGVGYGGGMGGVGMGAAAGFVGGMAMGEMLDHGGGYGGGYGGGGFGGGGGDFVADGGMDMGGGFDADS